MYEELVKRIRNRRICIQQSGCLEDFPLLCEAADAIEKLSAYAELYKDLAEKNQQMARKLIEERPCWIPVTERLPENLQNVLVIDDGRVTIGHCEHFYGDEQIYVDWHDTLYYPIDPPYWMPLPEPPKEGE